MFQAINLVKKFLIFQK